MTFEAASRINWEKIQKILGEDSVLVGYRNSDSHSSGLSMAELAEVLSFDHFNPQGAFVPARPHLLEGLEEAKPEIQKSVKKYFETLVETGQRNGDAVGQVCLDAVKEYLDSGILKGIAPNALSTIKAKGHDFPDIDTGELEKGLVYIFIRGNKVAVSTPTRQLPEQT